MQKWVVVDPRDRWLLIGDVIHWRHSVMSCGDRIGLSGRAGLAECWMGYNNQHCYKCNVFVCSIHTVIQNTQQLIDILSGYSHVASYAHCTILW